MINLNEQHNDEGFRNWQRRQRNGRIVAGILVILAGLAFMLNKMEYQVPDWVFTWPTLILGASLITAIRHGLNDWRWIVLFLVGSLFLAGYIYPDSLILEYKIPIVLFIIGAALIFKPKNKKHQFNKYRMKELRKSGFATHSSGDTTDEDYIYVNNVFAGTEKVVFSKDFKGGDIRNTFGGCDINLMQADIKDEAVLMLNQQFGGVKLVVPSHWVIKSDITCMFAGIEDKRPAIDVSRQGDVKTLILKGSIFMSGIELVSY